jgi:sulfur-oxidizing protein SoxY
MTAMLRSGLRIMWTSTIGAALGLGILGGALAAPVEPEDPWPGLVRDVFNGRPLIAGSGLLSIETPYRAEDAAIVPVTMRLSLPTGDARHVKSLTLVIDQNPAPVAATFHIGPDAGVSAISTRVRVDMYTNVHAVAELSDGSLHVTETFVKASGGCSAPAAKNAEEAKTALGQMRFRQFAAERKEATSAPREAQIMVRHPNNSGLQMDQLTRLYVPAFFVRELRLWQGEQLVFAAEAGISLSEDPNIRFTYRPNGAAAFRAEAVDTDGHVFKGEWPAEPVM